MPRDELVQDVGRADEAPGLPGEHAGGQHKGESIIFVRILFLMRCVIRCADALPFERAATPPVAQSRVAGKVESSPLQIPTIARIDGKTVWFRVASTYNSINCFICIMVN